MRYEQLMKFIESDMRMSHIYQPVMIRTLLGSGGRAKREDIARALLNEDRSQLEYYSAITTNMVGRVLANRQVVQRVGDQYELIDFAELTPAEVSNLEDACQQKLVQYVTQRGDAIWEHRRRSSGYVSGTLRYEVLKNARFRCELCGIGAEERALEVDHITPRNKGGGDALENLQALCFSCNAMKRDRDDTDFRAVRDSYQVRQVGCPFCEMNAREVLGRNSLAAAIADEHPVTRGHALIVPFRHVPDYFELGAAELRACQVLMSETRATMLREDASISGFNVGINTGRDAGQTVMHCHIHVIPRREGDTSNPRGGVRAVIPGKADY